MSKRPIVFEACSQEQKKRSRKFFERELETFDGEKSLGVEDIHVVEESDEETSLIAGTDFKSVRIIESYDYNGILNRETIENQENENENDDNLGDCDCHSCCGSDCDSENNEASCIESSLDEELYEGASMTVREFSSCITLLKSSLNQPDRHTCEILKLFSLVLPTPNRCPTSLYRLKKNVERADGSTIVKHFYCSNCVSSSTNTDHDPNNDESCEHEEISENLVCDCIEKKDYFIEIPLMQQLEALYNRPKFYEKLHKRSFYGNANSLYGDIYDGSIHKELAKPGCILSNLDNISFMWYTDGVRIFKSSKYNIWGFFLVILQLPYEDRYKLENILLVSLWFGDEKPKPNLFLNPLRKSLRQLYKGREFYVKDLERKITVRGIISCGTADLPAKALFLSMNQYNGRFGCQICVAEGCTVNRTRVYPFSHNLILRTDKDVLDWSIQALETGKPVCGVKGPAMIAKICPNFITSTAIDIMHNGFEGLSKKLLELWFDTKYANEDFSVINFIEIVDQNLCRVKPPSFVARRPRSIQTHSTYWKASEQKNWFFYYSLPILYDILPEEYFNHYKYIVLAIQLLCKNEITLEMVNLAENLIKKFVRQFEQLYGANHMTCNIHSLQHLPEVVRRLGPLWTTSCFPLEDINGKIKAFVHGSKKPELQIISNLKIHLQMHTFKYEWIQEDSITYNFYEELLGSRKKLKLTKVERDISIVGTATRIRAVEAERLITQHDLPGTNLFFFKKLYKEKLLYSSESAQKDQKYKSHFVTYKYGSNIKVGIIQNYLRVTNCDCKKFCQCSGKHFSCMKQLRTTNPFSTSFPESSLDYIHECIEVYDSLIMIDANDLRNVCFHLELGNTSYVCEPVNTIEFE